MATCALKTAGTTTDPCKMIQNAMACYPKDCCAVPGFKTATDAMRASAPAGCAVTCGANFVPATTTPGIPGANPGATTGSTCDLRKVRAREEHEMTSAARRAHG